MAQPASVPLAPNAHGEGAVLLIEDEPAIARMLTRLLVQAGLRVICVADIAEALVVLEKSGGDIAVALVDCHRTGDEHREFCRRLRSLLPCLKVVFTRSQELAMSSPQDVDGRLTVAVARPYLPTELVWKVRSLMVPVAG